MTGRLTGFTVVPASGPVSVRCIHCGRRLVLDVPRGECLLLTDLTGWAQAHECPPVRVT